MPSNTPLLSSVLPPLICGTATFNSQYNPDPYALPTTEIVHRAMSLGVRAFDTSPYYGPAEQLLGQALDTPFVHQFYHRGDYFLLTKVGRVGPEEFDYSEAWVRQSVKRSLERLRTGYLDVVYCHDVEFVTPEEVLTAVRVLRRIRDESRTLLYVGISGYPVTTLCDLAEMILKETGEPVDIVMSYANFTLQNTRLMSIGIPRFVAARVDVVLNASVLGMGLLRQAGVAIGSQGDWHPAPNSLRSAITEASDYCDDHNDRLENVAIRWALERWIHQGKEVGSSADPKWKHQGQRVEIGPARLQDREETGNAKIGVSVLGMSNLDEVNATMSIWESILDALEDQKKTANQSESDSAQRIGSQKRQQTESLAGGVFDRLESWLDYTWPSPNPGFVNKRKDM